jgi:hypothetical protein
MSKYEPLGQFLTHLQGDYWRPTFLELERLLGFDLPASARKKAEWWSADGGGRHGHAKSWLDAGWTPEEVSLERERVTFRRTGQPQPVAEDAATDARAKLEERARALKSWADERGQAAAGLVREKPMAAAGVSAGAAFAVGLVFGYLIGRPTASAGTRALSLAGEGARKALPLIVHGWEDLSERARRAGVRL